jgi:predicted permease
MLALRNAIRSLRRSPGFAAVSILSLAFALGLVAAVFGLVDALRFPRTAIRNPEQLFEIRFSGEGAAGRLTAADHIDVIERFLGGSGQLTYQGFARGEALSARGIRLEATGQLVSANYFPVLGVRPIAGRFFSSATADDDAAGSVVISERIWRQVFDSDPRLERLAVTIEGDREDRRAQVIGVVPQEFTQETYANFWLTIPADIRSVMANERYVVPILRVRPGVTIDSLNARFKTVVEFLTTIHGKGRREFVYNARPVKRDPLRIDEFSWLLIGAAFAVLVVACSNLANLILARGLARQNEMAIRFSLGARRADIIRSVLAESLVISLAGAALGIVAAAWGFDLLRTSMPERAGNNGALFLLDMNWRVIAMSAAAASIAGLLFGLLPAIRLSDVNLAAHIKEHSGTTTGRRRGRFPVLVIGQVALSLAMLTGVSLLLRASQKAKALDFGFDPARLLDVHAYTRGSVDTTVAGRLALLAAAEKRLRDLPNVESVAWRSGVSLYRSPTFTGERSGGATRSRHLMSYTYASANYLRTIGIPVIRGRDFEDRDAFSEGVVIVDSATALRIWGSEDPVGKLVKFAPDDRISPWFRVIGVSRPVLSGVPRFEGEEVAPQVVLVGKEAFVSPAERGVRPLRADIPGRSFVVRAKAADVPALRARIPGVMRDVLPPRGGVFVTGADDQRRDLIAQQRFLAGVFGAFGVLSLALCALGLYSVLAFSVSRRMREHGIRVALGASSRHIFLDVLHEGAILVVAGTALGGLATIWSNKLVDPYIGLLYHIDALALVAAEVVLVGVALASMVRPALRATRSDPVEVLRAV